MTYAQDTQVSAGRSRVEIERTLARYGATSFMYGWNGSDAVIAFVAHGRHIRLTVTMPAKENYRLTDTGRARSEATAKSEWEKAGRQRWRALALVIKAKLEAVESGIALFEDEFLAYTVLPDGSTAGEWFAPQMEIAYGSQKMPTQLELGAGKTE